MQEREAIRRCQEGELSALGNLYEIHHRAVFRTAYGIVGRQQLAEDVTQQVFIELFSSIKRYDRSRPFPPWLHRIAVSRSLDELRRRKKKFLPLEDAGDLRSTIPSPEEAAEQSELQETMQSAIASLKPDHRAAVVLRYYHGFSETEMSVAMDCRRGTVKSRLHHALRQLRKSLEPIMSPMGKLEAPMAPAIAGLEPCADGPGSEEQKP